MKGAVCMSGSWATEFVASRWCYGVGEDDVSKLYLKSKNLTFKISSSLIIPQVIRKILTRPSDYPVPVSVHYLSLAAVQRSRSVALAAPCVVSCMCWHLCYCQSVLKSYGIADCIVNEGNFSTRWRLSWRSTRCIRPLRRRQDNWIPSCPSVSLSLSLPRTLYFIWSPWQPFAMNSDIIPVNTHKCFRP
jgi:hypothetical protein